jgi:hypothetical protein
LTKKYKLVKNLKGLKKGTILELRGYFYVSGSTAFEAFSVWQNKKYFKLV